MSDHSSYEGDEVGSRPEGRMSLVDQLRREAERLLEADRERDAADRLGEVGWLELSSGRLNAAIESFRRAYRHDPSRSEFLREIAKTHHQLGRFGRAFDTYATAVETDYVNGEFDAARGLLRRMSRLEPNDVLRHAKLAELLAKLGKEERAVEELENCTDKLLHDQNDIEGFLKVARRILDLDPEYEALHRRIVELIVAEARVFVRYNLHARAEQLLRTAKEHTEADRSIREALAETYIDAGDEGRAVQELVGLARLSGDRDEQAVRYLQSAAEYVDEEELEAVAEELDLEIEALDGEADELDPEADWDGATPLGDETTDPENPSSLFRDQSTVTDREPVGRPDETGAGVQLAEPTETVDERDEETGGEDEYSATRDESQDTVVLPSQGTFWRLLALLSFAANSEGPTVVHARSTGNENLGRLWVENGRIVPALILDDEPYVDDIFRQRDTDLAGLYETSSAEDIRTGLDELDEPWGPSETDPVAKLVARGISGLLERATGEELIASRSRMEASVDPPTTFSPRSLAPEVAAHVSDTVDPRVERAYSAVEREGYDAWLVVPGDREDPDSLWLPVRTTATGHDTIDELVEIARTTRDLANGMQRICEHLSTERPTASILMSDALQEMFVCGDASACVVRIPQNMVGTILTVVRSALEADYDPTAEPPSS